MAARTDDRFPEGVGWSHVERLVAIGGRLGGSDAERRAAEATLEQLRELGAQDARLEPFEVQGWERTTAEVTADGNRIDPCLALPYSPAGSATGDLVDLGHGMPAAFEATDINGKVVVVSSDVPTHADRRVHRREKYALAIQHGAVGFVLRNHREGALVRSGSVHGTETTIGDIPAVGVTFEDGVGLVRRAEGEPVTVAVDAEIAGATSHNVVADLGPATDERVLFTCHLDSHDVSDGAMDNAAGVGVMVAVANALARRPEDLDVGVRFVGFGAEEFGLIGSAQYVRDHGVDGVKAVVQNDGVGRARDLVVHSHGADAIAWEIVAAARRHQHPAEVDPRFNPSSDHWRFVERGVPACLLGSDVAAAKSGFVMTRGDTLDKLDPRDVREHATVMTEALVGLAGRDVSIPAVPAEAVSRAVEAAGLERLAGLYERTAAVHRAEWG